ncbi:MAG: hypothetical protein JW712_07190 [Dehalococcoidales bacterium]|nr:hypothetical protein [Dehalococcoidales bacterium]
MTETKHGNQILRNPFHEAADPFGGKSVFTNAKDDNPPVIFEHHCITDPKWGIDGTRTSDQHELLCFIGGNPEKITDLGAEIRLSLGEDDEEQIIKDTTVVNIPPGLKNGNISITKFEKPFILLRLYTSLAYQESLKKSRGDREDFVLKRLMEGGDVLKHGRKYWMNTMSGPLYIDYEPGWTGTSIWAHHDEYRCGIALGYHCIATLYDVRMSHAHDNHENLCFLSGDPENPGELGAEVTVHLGDEQEEHYFNTPGIISMPAGLKHCPLTVDNITKPVIFLEVSATTAFSGKPEDV